MPKEAAACGRKQAAMLTEVKSEPYDMMTSETSFSRKNKYRVELVRIRD